MQADKISSSDLVHGRFIVTSFDQDHYIEFSACTSSPLVTDANMSPVSPVFHTEATVIDVNEQITNQEYNIRGFCTRTKIQ